MTFEGSFKTRIGELNKIQSRLDKTRPKRQLEQIVDKVLERVETLTDCVKFALRKSNKENGDLSKELMTKFIQFLCGSGSIKKDPASGDDGKFRGSEDVIGLVDRINNPASRDGVLIGSESEAKGMLYRVIEEAYKEWYPAQQTDAGELKK